MIDLAAYDLRPLSAQLSQLRKAKDFYERQALLEASDSNQAFSAGASAGSIRRDAPAAPRSVSSNALPYAGLAAPVAEPLSLAEQEWALGKAGAVKGGGSASAPALTGGFPAPPAPAASGAVSHLFGSAPRSPLAAKAGLAMGSQAAVVKLASFGSGAGRASSLLNYQSHKGELSLEREDGSLMTGKAAIAGLAAHWRGDEVRGPSNDVFAVTMRLEGAVGDDEVRDALGSALVGHKYAWRLEADDERTAVHLVAVAASSHRDAKGKLERIFANAKSEDSLFTKIDAAFGQEAEFSDVQWAHSVEGATTRLAALTKVGQFSAETEAGVSLEAAADRSFGKKPSNANRPKPEGFNPALEIAKAWRPSMRSSAPRDFAHVIMSAKPGTDKHAFMDAARATLAREFSGHEYVFVMHTNRQHIHVHAAVRLTHETGKKLDPNIQDFARWRQTLAEEARERLIPMEAVRRFDQAHAPAYKLKDVKMMERGNAPPNVRRRIERVQNHEIFTPTREEGRRHAAEAASNWKELGARQSVSLPPLAAGAMRLYRAETGSGDARRSPLFATDRALAESYAAKPGTGLVYLDVPAERLSELKPSREQPGKIFVVSPALSAHRKPVPELSEAAILPFQRRVEAALAPRTENKFQSQSLSEAITMRTAETMEAARKNMAEAMNRMGKFLAEGADKDALMRRAAEILVKAEAATKAQEILDRTPGEIAGEKHVDPKPREFGGLFTHAQKGSEIHYSRHDPETGKLRALAFIDKGQQLEVKDWNNPETVNAALKLASEKWETITVNGSAAYKETAARLAAEHGYTITNPEMQDRIRELRAELEARQAFQSKGRDVRGAAKPEEQPGRSVGAQPALNTTPAERAVGLEGIRERVDTEARRETRQAQRAQAAHETNAASGNEATPYRAAAEARAAREADQSADNNPSRPLPSDPNQSQAVQSLRHEQTQVLRQAEADRQRRIDSENAERLRQRDEQRARGETEGEGETR
ncbi:LPD7 domain-containing protein [Rhodoblastus sp.]|jgi:hypothetical protein|uniref:LPD7 domain-containing protein n=1 Tax=Rhodoblastus sp. TaxID=1962975 RepID=UPI0025E3BF5C|nr:LPD7 domain-containing protein [Rhodoblastus sp.]